MKLLKMPPGLDACLLYSAAMVLDVEPTVLIEEIGHDGQEVWWPNVAGFTDIGKRGHHIQEIIDCFLKRGYGLTKIEYMPRQAPQRRPELAQYLWPLEEAGERFLRLTVRQQGILIGESKSKVGHACAWNGRWVFDPNGIHYPLCDFIIKEFWLSVKSNHSK